MNREIKFKAKRLDNQEWVCGYFYEENDNTYIIENRQKESKLNRNITYQVDPNTVCQFTGLKDKNGKEVWEHDILAYSSLKGEVVFSKSSFCFRREDNGFDYTFSILRIIDDEICYCHIIGNKFDGKKNEEEK